MNTILETNTHKIETVGTLYVPTKGDTERQWRDSELLRTDRFVVIPDYPTDLLTYRAALRDYPSQPDFPNGTRPVE